MISLPTWFVIGAVLAVALLILIILASGMATRLNRLHIRTDAARISLEGALSARASVIAAVQPAVAAHTREVTCVPLRATDMGARSDAENALLMRLDTATVQHNSFIEASTRVDLAARFYNDAVSDTLAVRNKALVRALRLAGSAPLPEYYEAASVGQFSGITSPDSGAKSSSAEH